MYTFEMDCSSSYLTSRYESQLANRLSCLNEKAFGKEKYSKAAMADSLTEQQITECREAFSVFDKNGDGAITVKELGVVIRSLGHNPSEKELQEMINTFDEDGNGTIEWDEFLCMMSIQLNMQDCEEDVKETYRFRVFDKERKGYVNAGDLRYTLNHLVPEHVSHEEIEQLIGELDTDGDGQITYDEFLSMVIGEKRSNSAES